MPSPITLDALRLLPKVLLHDHLDGGLRPTTVIELADACGWTPQLPSTDPGELQAWFTRGADTRDLLQYLATFEHTLAVMQTAEALERVAYEAVVDLAADGVVYGEIRFAPELHQARGLALEAVIDAVAAGIRRGEREHASITVNLIICAMRTEQRSDEIVDLVVRMRYRDAKVVAFDLAGAETGFPPSLHAAALARARAEHLNITLHASEPPDKELISDALAHGAHRIGHGVRLRSDILFTPNGQAILGKLARYVLDHQIHLEMAPTCHVHVGAVESLAEHPIGPLLRLGFNVGVNTDNRLMSNVSPTSELFAVADTFDLSVTEIEQLVTNSMRSSFAAHELRESIIKRVIHPAFKSAVSATSAA
jgi:adenosine deaminase